MADALLDQCDLIVVQKQIGSRNDFRFLQDLNGALGCDIKCPGYCRFRVSKNSIRTGVFRC